MLTNAILISLFSVYWRVYLDFNLLSLGLDLLDHVCDKVADEWDEADLREDVYKYR